MKKYFAVILVFGLMLLSDCSDLLKSNNNKNDDPVDVLGYEIDEIPEKCIAANNDFSMNLFKSVNTEDQAKNVFLSPVSASFSLGMTMNGARCNT